MAKKPLTPKELSVLQQIKKYQDNHTRVTVIDVCATSDPKLPGEPYSWACTGAQIETMIQSLTRRGYLGRRHRHVILSPHGLQAFKDSGWPSITGKFVQCEGLREGIVYFDEDELATV